MNREERKKIAEQTLDCLQQGHYLVNGSRIDIAQQHRASAEASSLITPAQSDELVKQMDNTRRDTQAKVTLVSAPTLQVIIELNSHYDRQIGVLNFASAKNPGGGFLNGALAQEESLAIAGGLYDTQLRNERYYQANRACGTMMYTDHMIYSPQVVFIRDTSMNLLARPVNASVITAPAVNYGQVIAKRENQAQALQVMKNRMRKVLALFAAKGDRHIILGAYGCGVFRNDPDTIARYWYELFYDENYVSLFDHVVFAILDHSRSQDTFKAFQQRLGR